jgi:hypothetical protein
MLRIVAIFALLCSACGTRDRVQVVESPSCPTLPAPVKEQWTLGRAAVGIAEGVCHQYPGQERQCIPALVAEMCSVADCSVTLSPNMTALAGTCVATSWKLGMPSSDCKSLFLPEL